MPKTDERSIEEQLAEFEEQYMDWQDHPYTRKFLAYCNERMETLVNQIVNEDDEKSIFRIQGKLQEHSHLANLPAIIIADLEADLKDAAEEGDE
jgi:hypothetical protein